MLTRRQFIAGAAATGVVVVGGATVRAAQTGVFTPAGGEAYSPWERWATATGPERLALAAILAGSSHNTQPWRVRATDTRVELFGDKSRRLGQLDALGRELHMSLGAALENVSIAAAGLGMRAVYEIARDGDGHHAVVDLSSDAEPPHAELAEQIPLRHTNRAPYDGKPVAAEDLAKLAAIAPDSLAVRWLTSATDKGAFTDLATRSTVAHVDNATMQADSHKWYRLTAAEVEEHRDGVTIDGAGLPFVVTAFLKMFPPTPDSFDAQWPDSVAKTTCGTASGFGLLLSDGEGRQRKWIEAGRTWQRMQLQATAMGLALQPVSQPVAMRDLDRSRGVEGEWQEQLLRLSQGKEVVFAFRFGSPKQAALPSPRRGIELITI